MGWRPLREFEAFLGWRAFDYDEGPSDTGLELAGPTLGVRGSL